jgi:hypothetical protein
MATTDTAVDKTVSKLEHQLEQWGSKLDALVAKAEAAGEQAKSASRSHLADLKVKLGAAQTKLHDAKTAGSAKWGTFKQDVERSWNELDVAFKKLAH